MQRTTSGRWNSARQCWTAALCASANPRTPRFLITWRHLLVADLEMKRSGFEFQITTRSLSQQWLKIMRSSCNNVPDFGLMYYGARWYDPYLNHFTQPDSIVPDPYNPQGWDRYAYVLNNPLRYTDP